MNEVLHSNGGSGPRSVQFSGLRRAARFAIWCALLVTVIVCIQTLHSTLSATAYKNSMPALTTHAMGLVAPVPKRLSGEFVDSQGRLLADPPVSASALLDPPALVVAHIKVDEADGIVIPWDQFDKHLAAVTGRSVQDVVYENTADQIADAKKGKFTVVALHAAETPFLVNNCGFEPQAVFGDESGVIGNHVDIVVPPDSPITKAADLRGRSLVCTVPSSITGYRAAVALLMKNEGMRPNVDYTIVWSLGQKKSIYGVAKKTFSSAAISDDKLQGMLRSAKISPGDYRIVYASEIIPRTTIGYFYSLKPELAGKIREAILSFRPEKDGAKPGDSDAAEVDASGKAAKSLHFIPVDYKRDFELVRLIDDSFDPRLGGKPIKLAKDAESPATAPAASARAF